jgi:hypothetical protein
MTLLTDENLKLLYKTFCRMEPFNKLKMPYTHEIKLKVTRRKDIMGEFAPDENTIYISSARNAHFDTICKTLLHEMAHLVYRVCELHIFYFGGLGMGRVQSPLKLDIVRRYGIMAVSLMDRAIQAVHFPSLLRICELN